MDKHIILVNITKSHIHIYLQTAKSHEAVNCDSMTSNTHFYFITFIALLDQIIS